MKQFSLEEYLKNPKRKIVTRDGHSVRIICTDKKSWNEGADYCIVALILYDVDENKNESAYCYDSNGWYINSKNPNPMDLFFVSETHEGWVNIYSPEHIYSTEESAKMHIGDFDTYIDTVKIKWEE